MKIVAISDTHGQHAKLTLPKGDLLLHAGDVSNMGKEPEVMDFLHWFQQQDYKHKVFIAGNHDFFFERESDATIEKIIPPGIIYLNDSGVTIDGINFWGSPITPWFFNWAFNRHRGESISRYWNLIPANTDVLITHGPPFRALDKNVEGQHIGCKDLLLKVREVKPRFHIFGHIHESYGSEEKYTTRFINASVLNEKYRLTNNPVELEV